MMENKSGGISQDQSLTPKQPPTEKPNQFGSDLPADQSVFLVAPDNIQPKKRKWPYIFTGAMIVIITSLSTSYFLVVDGANKAADAYESSLRVYLETVYGNLIQEDKSLTDIRDENSKLDTPKLTDAVLGSLSPKYSDAKILRTKADGKINDLETALDGYIAVANFEKVAIDAVADMQSLQPAPAGESGINYLKALLSSIVQIQVVTNENIANAPDDLESNFEVIATQYTNMMSALSDLISAYEKNNSAEITSALTKYYNVVEANSDSSSAGAIASYYKDLDSKYDIVVADFKEYIGSF